MKKIIFIISIFIAIFSIGTSANAGFAQCDQVFDWWMLRYNYSYPFYDTLHASTAVYLWNWYVDYDTPSYLDQWSPYDWTSQLVNNWYKVNQNSSMKVIETWAVNWRIANHPTTRTNWTRNSYDFWIRYTLWYDYDNTWKNINKHTECVYYSISWCGDGVLDTGYGEKCDPNDPDKKWWWSGWCDQVSCSPVNSAISCDVLSVSPSSGYAPMTSNFVCNATWANKYTIKVKDSNWTILSTINSDKGSYTFSNTWNYNVECVINDDITGPACAKPVTVTKPPVWGWVSCDILTATPSSWKAPLTTTLNCEGSWSSEYKINIKDGSWNIINTINSSTWSYTFGNNGNYTAECIVGTSTTSNACSVPININPWSSSSSSSGWNTSSSSSSGWNIPEKNYCGDGIVQRPNDDGIKEQCDFGWSAPWSSWPEWCGAPSWPNACMVIEDTNPGWRYNPWDETTYPGWLNVDIGPSKSIVIGWNMSLFGHLNKNIIIKNPSDSDVYLETPICMYKRWFNSGTLSGPTDYCYTAKDLLNWSADTNRESQDFGWIKANWSQTFVVPESRYVTSTTNLWANTYEDWRIITTFKWLRDSSTFLKSILNVRVSKPSVSTYGWWSALINWTNLSNISELANFGPFRPSENKNLILSSLWINPLSSYTKEIEDQWFINSAKDNEKWSISWLDKDFSSWINTWTINWLPNERYNWLSNIYIHNWNVNISTQTISGANKTYIIEDGDLTISWDIKSDYNILFVIKNWNINIENNVSRIDAILIDMWWKIKWWSGSTENRIVINGAVYWNVDDLLAKRVYILAKDEADEENMKSLIEVWTNINFSSKVFSSPPPLLSKFLWEYIDWGKVPN